MIGSVTCSSCPFTSIQGGCMKWPTGSGCESLNPKKDYAQHGARKETDMDINTMLSAAYDAYEKVKMEATAMQETIKELQEENDALKENIKALESTEADREESL